MSIFKTRVFIKEIDDYANVKRSLLKIRDSALVDADTGVRKAYIGLKAKNEIVDPETKTTLAGEVVSDLPIDFRMAGIAVMNARNIPTETQALMFEKFIQLYTKEQRKIYIGMFAAIDPSDQTAIDNFVNQMLSMLVA